MRQARKLAQRPDHGVQGVGDADHKGIGRMGLDAFADRFHHLQVDAQKVITAHPRLARHAGGDDADICARDVFVGIRALQRRVKALNRARLRDVQRLALRRALGDVKKDDVPQFLEGGEVGKGAADLACADKGDFGSCHGFGLRVLGCVRGCDCILSYAKPVRPKRQPRCAAARSWAGPGLAIALTGFHGPWGRRWPHRFGIARHHGGFARQGEEAWKALAFGRLPSWLRLWSA